jgi:hypothetical protein
MRTDQGSQYDNALLADYLKYDGTTQTFTLTPYTPMQVGKVERKNQEVMRHLTALVMERDIKSKWSRVLPLVQRIVNNTWNRSIGCTPMRYVFGSRMAENQSLLVPAPKALTGSVEDLVQQLDQDLREVVAASLKHREAYLKERLKHEPSASTVYPTDSYVLVKYVVGKAPKLTRWRGPYLVVSHNGNAYTLQDLTTLAIVHFDLSFLKAFDPSTLSPTDLVTIARKDAEEAVIDHIVSYTGTPSKRNTLEFRVRWKDSDPDDDTYHWHRQIKDTEALDEFIKLHPELKVLNKPSRK